LGNPADVDETSESGAGGSGAVDLGAVLAGGGVEVELAAKDRRRGGAVASDAYVGVGCGTEFGAESPVLEGEIVPLLTPFWSDSTRVVGA
jgi:hypothetical protein